jgi:serine/threonine protein kinase
MDACLRCGRDGETTPAGLCTTCSTKPNPAIGATQLLKELHSGPASNLYLGWNPEQHRHVAVKILKPLAENRKKRFLREAKQLAGLKHPNLAAIHEFGTLPGGPLTGHYLIMDYISGGSLAETKLSVKKELDLLLQAAEAASLLHKKNMIHRAIRPSNILIDPAEGRAILTDFDFARPGDDEPPEMPSVHQPNFLSPEQARGEPKLTPTSDVYSLGATLYFLITGVPPFSEARTFKEYLSLVSVTRPLPPSHLNREISKDYESLVFRSMDASAEKRIQKVDEFMKLLREAMRKGTVPAGMIRKRSAAAPAAIEKPAASVSPEMIKQIDARLEPVETLLSHAEQTNRRISSGEGTGLEQTLKGCLALHPSNAKAYVLLGRLYLLLDRGDEAVEALDQAVKLSPTLTAPLHYRAMQRLKKLQLARPLSKISVSDQGVLEVSHDPLTPETEELRRQLLEDFRTLTDAYGAAGDPRQFFTRGVLELFSDQIDIGYELLRRSVDLLPQNPDPPLYLGVACLYKKDLEKAIEAFDKSAALRRSGVLLRYMVLAHETLARLKRSKGENPSEDYRNALKSSDDLVKVEPDSVDVWVQRATLLMTAADALTRLNQPCTREIREASEITRKMIEKHPEVAAFYNIRGEMRRMLAEVRLARGEKPAHLLDQAIPEYRKALELDPVYFPGLVNLSAALLLKAKNGGSAREDIIQEALQLCLKAGELRPNHADPFWLRGRCHQELGKLDAAIEDWREAARVDPSQSARFEALITEAKAQ